MNKRLLIAAVLWIGMGAVSVCVGTVRPHPRGDLGHFVGRRPSDTARRALLEHPAAPGVVCGGGRRRARPGRAWSFKRFFPILWPRRTCWVSAAAARWGRCLPWCSSLGQGRLPGRACLSGGDRHVACALWLARFVQGSRVLGMVLAGIVVGSAASAMLMILKYLADPQQQLPVIEYWLMGGFQDVTGSDLPPLFLWTAVPALVLYLLRFSLKVLSLGDEAAGALGLRPHGVRPFGGGLRHPAGSGRW